MKNNRANLLTVCASLFRLAVTFGVVLLTSCEKATMPPDFFPQTGDAALHQYTLDLLNDFKVLNIAPEPGFEDLATLAYARMARGATIMAAFLSNGEGGDQDEEPLYPPYAGARRRNEAKAALKRIGGDVYFLNLPHVVAARDTAAVRTYWPADTLRARLKRLILDYKPDVILLTRDRRSPENPILDCLLADLTWVIRDLRPAEAGNDHPQKDYWRVDRVFVQAGENEEGKSAPVDQKHPIWKVSYQQMAVEAGKAYRSLARQRAFFHADAPAHYRLHYPRPGGTFSSLFEGYPKIPSPRLQWIYDEITYITRQVREGKIDAALPHFVTVLDSINLKLAQRFRLQAREIRSLLRWNIGIENFRCAVRGITAAYSISDTCLTNRQLTYLTIEEVKNINNANQTVIYFGLDANWIINESTDKRFDLELNQAYRILTPSELNYTVPQALYGQDDTHPDFNLIFFLIQRSNDRSENFLYRQKVPITFAPKFVTEVLTPIVRKTPDARLVIRMQNNSRDSVRDTVKIKHDYVSSPGAPFRLASKGAFVVDTLELQWQGDPPVGSFRVPVEINGFTVAHFVVRHFPLRVDAGKRIGLISGFATGPTAFALQQMDVDFDTFTREGDLRAFLGRHNVVILDYRAMTFLPHLSRRRDAFADFVRSGGHLIILAQDPEIWNRTPLFSGITLERDHRFDPDYPMDTLFSAEILKTPNPVNQEDWDGWLYRRAYHRVMLSDKATGVDTLLKDSGGNPQVVIFVLDKGKWTWVNLALSPQFLNVHAGAFKLLANLISY